jgi:hypothetical protein
LSWTKGKYPLEGGDSRKLVTLKQDGMIWVGIRAHSGGGIWLNNGTQEKAEVLAWMELPAPAYSDGLMQPMGTPTLPEGVL